MKSFAELGVREALAAVLAQQGITDPFPIQEQTIPDVSAVLEVLKQQEERKPGSVVVRVGRHAHTVIVVGEELLNEYSQADLELS